MIETVSVSYTKTITLDTKTITETVSTVVPIGFGSMDAVIFNAVKLLKASIETNHSQESE